MPEAQNQPIERKEATNEQLDDGEMNAIKSILEANKNNPDQKNEIIKKYFDFSELQNPEKEQMAFLIEKQMQLLYIWYKTGDEAFWMKDNKEFLEVAFGLMQLHNPDKYGKTSTFYKRYVDWEWQFSYMSESEYKNKNDSKTLKSFFYTEVEREWENIFVRPSDIFQKYNTEKITVSAKDYEDNKTEYELKWWKKKQWSEKMIAWEPETILVAGDPIDMPTQYFYKWQSGIDIKNEISNMKPLLISKIDELKNNPNIDPNSIEIRVRSSVSNISYDDNKGLLWRRSNYYKNIIEEQLPGQKVLVDNKEYSSYGPEWGPAYPPAKNDLETYFAEGSEWLIALQNVEGFGWFDDVVTSMKEKKADSKYFDVLEKYMYRLFQYTSAEIVYQERKEIPTNEMVFELEKQKGAPLEKENTLNRTAGAIITRNPYYEWNAQTKEYKIINGITYPVNSRYMILQFSDKRGARWMTQRYPLADNDYSLKIPKSITNRSMEEWKRGESKQYSQQLTLLLDGKKETIDNFSSSLIWSDVLAGRHVINKEKNDFINNYISQNIATIDATVEKEKEKLKSKS